MIDSEVSAVLGSLLPVFATAAQESLNALFSIDGELRTPWEVVPRLEGSFDHFVAMGSANDRFSGIVIVGTTNAALSAILQEDEISLEYAADVLGEFLNTYCACLDDSSEFSEAYGKMIQAVPLFFHHSTPFMPFLSGVQGVLFHEDHPIYIGYAIQPVRESHINK